MVQFGSSLFFYCCADQLIQDERVRGNPFLIPETYSVAAGTNNGGTLQKWYLEQLFSECLEKEKTAGLNAYEEMMKGISEIAPGSDGLITLPYFAGERTPLNDPDARGMIVGLSLSHTKRHLYRSALEGIGYSVAQHIDIFRENGLPVKRIAAAGEERKTQFGCRWWRI
ncbi:MAG: FGGY-family carbohydrate kinase [Clostridium sp.]